MKPGVTPAPRSASPSSRSASASRSSSSSRCADLRHLFVTNDFPPKRGGIESYLTTLCKGFEPDDVVVVAPSREGSDEVDAQLPYEVVRLPKSYLRATRSTFNELVDVVRRTDVDAVHFLAALPLGRLGPRLRNRTGVPFTVVAHGTGEILLPARFPIMRQMLRKVLVEADVVFCVSAFTRGRVDKLSKERAATTLLPPSVDVDRFSLDVSGAEVRDRLGVGGRFVVFFVSRLVKRKGTDVLIRAVAGLKGVVAIVGGAGPERASLERLARELDASDRVIFTGTISEDELPAYYAAADVFCMPCSDRFGGVDTEGFGVVYLEAQATGIPCIAGRCGGSAEAADDGQTGVVLDEPTPRSVAAEIVRFRSDPALCASFGGSGRARMERDFAPDVAAATLEEAVGALSAPA